MLKELRFYLFPIKGDCQHSGNCCRGIMLYYDNEAITSLKKYQLLSSTFSHDKRFVPNMGSSDSQCSEESISSYNCSKLSSQNKCLSYHDRPQLCRQYPWSYFYDHGRLKPNCGYFIAYRRVYFPFIPISLTQLIRETCAQTQ